MRSAQVFLALLVLLFAIETKRPKAHKNKRDASMISKDNYSTLRKLCHNVSGKKIGLTLLLLAFISIGSYVVVITAADKVVAEKQNGDQKGNTNAEEIALPIAVTQVSTTQHLEANQKGAKEDELVNKLVQRLRGQFSDSIKNVAFQVSHKSYERRSGAKFSRKRDCLV